ALRTILVKDVASGPASSKPAGLESTPGGLFFSADDGVHGRELWRVSEDQVPNTAPSFIRGSDQTTTDEGGAETITGWATAISAGTAGEAGQELNFVVTADQSGLFATQPAIDASGRLSFNPAPNVA